MPFKAVRARSLVPTTPPAPVPVSTVSPSGTTVRVLFDLGLQPVGPADVKAWFPNVVSNPFAPNIRLLSPDPDPLTGTISVAIPIRLQVANGLSASTAGPGRIRYSRAAGDLLIGLNGTPVEEFDLPVPWP